MNEPKESITIEVCNIDWGSSPNLAFLPKNITLTVEPKSVYGKLRDLYRLYTRSEFDGDDVTDLIEDYLFDRYAIQPVNLYWYEKN